MKLEIAQIFFGYSTGAGVALGLGVLVAARDSIDWRKDRMNSNLSKIGLAYDGHKICRLETLAQNAILHKQRLLAQVSTLPILSWLGVVLWVYDIWTTLKPRKNTQSVLAIRRLETEGIFDRKVIASLLIEAHDEDSDCLWIDELRDVASGAAEGVSVPLPRAGEYPVTPKQRRTG